MLIAWHSANFTALPYKLSGQAALNLTMEVKQSVLHVVYLHFKEKKGKSPSLSLIPHAFSKNIKYTLLCVFLYLQILAAKITSMHCIFPVFFGSNRALSAMARYIESLKTNIQKIPHDLVHNYQLVYTSLWFYASELGCRNLPKKTTFRPKMRIIWHNADPWNY